jgi:hypothetical protein
MAEPKTKVNDTSVADFLCAIPNQQVRDDCRAISGIMQAATKSEPRMWGSSIVGFGDHHSVYASGREGDWMLIGFSPRKQNIAIYIMDGFDRHGELMARLGTHSCGKSCLYIKRLADIHLPTFQKLVRVSVQDRMKSRSAAPR